MQNKMLSKKYEIKREIGRGGMGVIYEALDTALNRKVAIKILHAQFSGDTNFLKRFQREARAMARLDHEHIIKVYDVGEEEGSHFIVMEYFAGEDLKIRLSEKGVLPPKEALSIVLQISKALSYSHAQGVIHRDIKPANIMVSSSGIVKIADFGIAAATDESSLTSTGNIIGTPAYMSPEQANGKLLDGRSDLYALGMVFYEMLTGKTSYFGTSGRVILVKLATEQKEFKLIFPSHISAPIQGLVGRLLKKNRDNRVSDAKTLSQMLAKIEADLLNSLAKTIIVSESSLPEEVVSRPKWPIYLAGIVLLSMVFIGASYQFFSEKEEKVQPIPVESSSLDEIRGLQRSIRKVQKKLTTSRNEADQPETRRLVAEVFDQAMDLENKGSVFLEDGENLILKQDHKRAREKLQRVVGLLTRADKAYLKAKELTGPRKTEEKRKLAEQEKLRQKQDQERLEKEKLEKEKQALILLVDVERKKREKMEQENQDREKRNQKKLKKEQQARLLLAQTEHKKREKLKKEQQARLLLAQAERRKREKREQETRDRERREKEKLEKEKQELILLVETEQKKREKLEQENQIRKKHEKEKLEKEKKAQILRAKTERLAQERLKAEQELAQARRERGSRLDLKVVRDLFFKLKGFYERKDLKSLQGMSEMTQQQARFLQQIFKNYKTIKVSILNLSITGDSAEAVVSITELISQDNTLVFPSKRWKDSKLVIHKNDGQWGKILW